MISTSATTRRLLTAAAALMLSAGSAAAQQASEQAVPAGNANTRRPPPAVLTGTGPNGATIRCRDGSYPAPKAADSACDGKGGVLVRFPMRATPQQMEAPSRPQRQTVRSTSPDTTRPAGFIPWRERQAQAAAEEAAKRPPAGATLRCGDGTWVTRDTSSTRCATRGGVSVRVTGAVPRRGQ